MTKVALPDNRLVAISRLGNSLIVRRSSLPYDTRQLVVAILSVLAVGLFAAAIFAATAGPQVRLFLALLGLVDVLLTIRMSDINAYPAKEEILRFDKSSDTVERNGQEISLASEVDHILVRRILVDDNEDPESSDYALVVALENTKRFTIAESRSMPGARGQVWQAAEQVAEYLGVSVREGERLPGEDWMDR
jgi:hypothetical protein